MTCTRGLTAVDQAGMVTEGRFAIAASSNGELPIDGCDFLEGVTMSISRSLSGMTAGILLAALLLLAGCGGGGGGGDGGGGGGPDPLVYPGTTSQAVATTTNSSKLTANVIGSGQTVGIIGGVSVESGDATQIGNSGLMELARRLNRIFRDTVVRAEQASPAQRPATAVIPVDQTEPCDAGQGTVHFSGTLNDNGTGTVQASFTNCLVIRDMDGNVATNETINLNGSATMRVDVFDLVAFEPTDYTVSFVRLTLRGSGLSIDAGGSFRAQVNIGTSTETITANLVSLNNITGEMTKTEPLTIVSVPTSQTSFTANISGKVFDQVHGYVDITTPTLLVFGTLTQFFPNSGQILLTGSGNSSIRVTALSATLARLQLDLDGNGVVDNTATLKWIDLTGPVGANLGDTDNDGMHNSWETVNGLNPAVNDAAGDKDGDLITNINEYLAGTAP